MPPTAARCRHRGVATAVIAWCKRLVCSRCGSKNIDMVATGQRRDLLVAKVAPVTENGAGPTGSCDDHQHNPRFREGRMCFAIYIVVIGASLATTALAAAPSADFNRCIDAHTTNADWAVCSNQEIARQEADLAAAWKAAYAAMKRRDAKAADDLLQEQRAWIRFKDLGCQYYARGAFGREGQVLDYATCKASILADRSSDLRGLTKDLSK